MWALPPVWRPDTQPLAQLLTRTHAACARARTHTYARTRRVRSRTHTRTCTHAHARTHPPTQCCRILYPASSTGVVHRFFAERKIRGLTAMDARCVRVCVCACVRVRVCVCACACACGGDKAVARADIQQDPAYSKTQHTARPSIQQDPAYSKTQHTAHIPVRASANRPDALVAVHLADGRADAQCRCPMCLQTMGAFSPLPSAPCLQPSTLPLPQLPPDLRPPESLPSASTGRRPHWTQVPHLCPAFPVFQLVDTM